MPATQPSSNLFSHVLALEGLHTRPYKTHAGLTVGAGHLLTQYERASGSLLIAGKRHEPFAGPLSERALTQLAKQDLAYAGCAVARLVKHPLNQHQFDALTLFTFNVGEGALASSYLLETLNSGLPERVPEILAWWVNYDGARRVALIKRRALEIKLWKGEL